MYLQFKKTFYFYLPPKNPLLRRENFLKQMSKRTLDQIGMDCLDIVASYLSVRDIVALSRANKLISSMLRNPSHRGPDALLQLSELAFKCLNMCDGHCQCPRPRVICRDSLTFPHPFLLAPLIPSSTKYLASQVHRRRVQLQHTVSDETGELLPEEVARIERVRDANWAALVKQFAAIGYDISASRGRPVYADSIDGFFDAPRQLMRRFLDGLEQKPVRVTEECGASPDSMKNPPGL